MTDGVVLAHDYATQRGGAERVALLMAAAFPGAPMYTTLYDPPATFPEFGDIELRTSALNRVPLLRRNHRLALPLLDPAIDRQAVAGEVLVASSTGWAHGYRGAQRTVVYCHAPARWLYQRDRYLGPKDGSLETRMRRWVAARSLDLFGGRLRKWDQAAAGRADVYLANSSVTQAAIREVYGRDAEVLPPPPALLPDGPVTAIPGLEDGYLLCVARLLPYKNVDVVIEAAIATGTRLVVVGEGPDHHRLQAIADRGRPGDVQLLGRVDDETLRWLYANAGALIAASHEDYGLSPLEAGAFGRPSIVLRAGGFLDTVVEGVNGTFFGEPTPDSIAEGIEAAGGREWDDRRVRDHVEKFGAERFAARLHGVVSSLLGSSETESSADGGNVR